MKFEELPGDFRTWLQLFLSKEDWEKASITDRGALRGQYDRCKVECTGGINNNMNFFFVYLRCVGYIFDAMTNI